jgi:hypothetical protein
MPGAVEYNTLAFAEGERSRSSGKQTGRVLTSVFHAVTRPAPAVPASNAMAKRGLPVAAKRRDPIAAKRKQNNWLY